WPLLGARRPAAAHARRVRRRARRARRARLTRARLRPSTAERPCSEAERELHDLPGQVGVLVDDLGRQDVDEQRRRQRVAFVEPDLEAAAGLQQEAKTVVVAGAVLLDPAQA